MTQTDIDTGRLVMEIGFAPLRPAEFIILRIEQSIPGSAGALGTVLAPMVQAVRKAKQGHTQLYFVGGNGTAKTFAANALAGALEVPLYRIDLSQVVSKYIGETEKNLLRVFKKVEAADAILFFDEADALFGKWASATGRHDRYANLETNYLLERINEYPGVVILDLERKPKHQRNVFAFD